MSGVNTRLDGSATLVALAIVASVGFSGAIYGPTLSTIALLHGITVAAAGLMISAHGVGAFLAVAMCLSSKIEGYMRFRATFALALIGIGAIIVASAGSFLLLYVGAMAIGCGYGFLTVGLNGLFSRSFGKYSRSMVNLLNAVFGIGSVSAPFIFVQLGGSVSAAFFVLSVFVALLILPSLRIDDRNVVEMAPAAHVMVIERRVNQVFPLVIMFCVIGMEVTIIGWGPAVLTANGVDTLAAASAGSWFFIVYLLSRSLAVLLSLYISFEVIFMCVLAILSVLAVGAWFANDPYGWFVAFGVAGMIFPNGFGWFVGALGNKSGAGARVILAALLGSAVVPLIIGWLLNEFGVEILFVPVAFVLMVSFVLAAVFSLMHRF